MAAVTEATREIARTTDSLLAREVICSAACTITGARFAKLMERDQGGDLVMTANYGLQGAPPLGRTPRYWHRTRHAGSRSGPAISYRRGIAIPRRRDCR